LTARCRAKCFEGSAPQDTPNLFDLVTVSGNILEELLLGLNAGTD
jgi:hypothetical protein